jgi:regulation of enolase protein 1 (concanavalin A-like superfamily)
MIAHPARTPNRSAKAESLRPLNPFLAAFLMLAALGDSSQAQSALTLAWAASSDTTVIGYHVYQGGLSHVYTNVVDVQNVTSSTVQGLSTGDTYYFAVTAYDSVGLESAFSNEVAYNALSTNPPPTLVLTAPVPGASYSAPATIPLAASVTANGHVLNQVQFYNGATLLGAVAAAPYAYSWNTVPAGTYSVTAQVVYDGGAIIASSPVSVTVLGSPVLTLPAPWQTTDIGLVGVAGSATVTNGVFSVQGAGSISGSADSFRFVYQALSADGQIQACLRAPQTAAAGGAGVMIRESLTDGSRYVFMGLSGDASFRWQSRKQTGAFSDVTLAGSGTPPQTWVRVVRAHNTLSGYKSVDGITWTRVSSQKLNMAANIYIGLAVASGNASALNTAVFSNLTVVP